MDGAFWKNQLLHLWWRFSTLILLIKNNLKYCDVRSSFNCKNVGYYPTVTRSVTDTLKYKTTWPLFHVPVRMSWGRRWLLLILFWRSSRAKGSWFPGCWQNHGYRSCKSIACGSKTYRCVAAWAFPDFVGSHYVIISTASLLWGSFPPVTRLLPRQLWLAAFLSSDFEV